MLDSSISDGPDLREPTYLSAYAVFRRYGLYRQALLESVPPDMTVPWGGPDRRVGRWLPETVERFLSGRAEAHAQVKQQAERERIERRSACVEEHPVEVVGRGL